MLFHCRHGKNYNCDQDYIPLLCFVYLGLVEESLATGISVMAVFVSFNYGHNYFKFQSYGKFTHKINMHKLLNSFLTV